MELSVPIRHAWHMPKPKHYFKEYRKRAGLNQVDAAIRIGIDRSHLSKIESGARQYNQSTLEAAAHVYECSTADLISKHPGVPAKSHVRA